MFTGPIERCFGGGNGGDDLQWHVDLKPYASGEFSIASVQANSSLEDQAQVFSSPSAAYFGVYDGHGGPHTSRFIAAHLFPFLHKFAIEQGGVSADAIKKAFAATEEEFFQLVKRSWENQPEMVSVGSCCLFGAISNGVLHVANLGDSRAVLGKRTDGNKAKGSSSMEAVRLSTDHNVGVEEVRKEVAALHPDDAHIVVYTRGVWRIKGIIQVSRSIGDIYLKKLEFNKDILFQQFGYPIQLKRAVMTSEPSILTRKLKPQDEFLIFASDGLWEQLTDQAAVDIVSKSPRAGVAKRLLRAAIREAARKREMRYDDITRIEKGVRRYFHDDITVIVVYMDNEAGLSNGRSKDRNLVDCTSTPADIFSLDAAEAQC